MISKKQSEFLGLLSSWREPLIAYLRYLLWKKEGLEDALQSVLLVAYQKFGDFQPGTNFRAWIFQIATHTVFNINRRYQKESKLIKPMTEDVPDPSELRNNLDYRVLLKQSDLVLDEMSEEVKNSILALNETERSIFLLRSVGELTYEEIARILSIPVGSVMGNLSRARVKLREKLLAYAKTTGILR